MKHCKIIILVCVMACILSMTAFAQSAPTETIEVPSDLDADILSTMLTLMADGTFAEVTATEETADPLTPDGNLTLVDDIVQENKQFITVQSKNGNYFYLVIDRSGDEENVYFLNLVDESDLLALIETEPMEDGVCICTEPCIDGTVNHDCPVCDMDTAGCQADMTVSEPEEVEVEAEPETIPEVPEETETTSTSPWPMVIVVIGSLGVGVLCYFKFIKKKQPATPSFDHDEDYDDYEIPDENEEPEDSLY